MVAAGESGMPALPRFYLITDLERQGEEKLEKAVAAAGRGGLRMVQVREKDRPRREVTRLVARLRGLLPAGTLIIANGTGRRPDFAAEVGADGIHLGGGNLKSVAAARRALPPGAIIGYSAHSSAELDRAAESGASYASLSPIFPPHSKYSALPALGLEALKAACLTSTIPVYALGGIDVARAAQVRAAGAFGAAAIGAILDAKDPESAMREMLAAVEGEIPH
jgi:thiamine-phosphate pyrophosphorylase